MREVMCSKGRDFLLRRKPRRGRGRRPAPMVELAVVAVEVEEAEVEAEDLLMPPEKLEK